MTLDPALPSPPPQPDAATPGALLPCPWCGSRMVVADGRLSGTHETTWTYAVVCRCCEASGPPEESPDSDLARGDAESAWQSRAPAPPEPAATAGITPCHICGYHPGSAACSAGHNAPPGTVKAEAPIVDDLRRAYLKLRDALWEAMGSLEGPVRDDAKRALDATRDAGEAVQGSP